MCIRDRDMVDFRDSANQIGIVYREKIRKLNDFFIHGARKWFEEIDEKGYILRPIIYKSQWDYKQIGLLAKAFKKMLVNNATIEQLGSDPVSYTHLDVYKRQTSNLLIKTVNMF